MRLGVDGDAKRVDTGVLNFQQRRARVLDAVLAAITVVVVGLAAERTMRAALPA